MERRFTGERPLQGRNVPDGAKQSAEEQWSDYKKSDSVVNIPARCPKKTVEALMSADPSDVAERRERAQAVLDMLCLTGRVSKLPLRLSTERVRSRGKYEYDPETGFGKMVTLYDAPGGTKASNDDLLRTLCHEFCHHYDVQALGLRSQFHTLGFEIRADALYRKVRA